MPATVRIYQGPTFDVPVLNKSFFKADKVTMSWNSTGSAVLVSSQTDVDKSNQSYYGETSLYYLSVATNVSVIVQLGWCTRRSRAQQGDAEGTEGHVARATFLKCLLPSLLLLSCFCLADKEGPIYDAAWSPDGNEFVAVYGFMPARGRYWDLCLCPTSKHNIHLPSPNSNPVRQPLRESV